ncbi:DEAD/DEAH box helicase family protein [Sporolactobacillus sp. CPB3-1]|uniref:DEAD/DEAH box helicase family protein n=1 Tax=Sporolactobacillus mangiferae TaxID=2940498 RepID=A0ABT0MEG3_9BACL|nr:helicase-related protein [Sporolactobacillus mangiferae]MCL1632659.1 DEAD/DEAH box helicase family protein [Sporolactobacillus mangiferae]
MPMLLLSRKSVPTPNDFTEVQHALHGREFRAEELPFPEKRLKEYVNAGYVSVRHGIIPLNENIFDLLTGKKKWLCVRCGNREQESFAVCSCARCGSKCVYCRHCLTMGIVRACTKLVTWCGPVPELRLPEDVLIGRPLCHWKGSLSSDQQKAAEALLQALEARESFLIWAVAGAGKTEIIYSALEQQLKKGHRVVLATPRTDVVRELLPRIRAAFPDIPVSGLYAGSKETIPDAPLVISTAHQLIRSANRFDCVFIDEVDAFPYHFDAMLDYAVRKAAKPNAPFIFLTATPPDILKNAYLSGKLRGVMLARRYHGYPLPVPRFQWIGNGAHAACKGWLPYPLSLWLRERITQKRQAFIFVPSIALVHELTELLQRSGYTRIAGVHADDPHRHEKLADFREGRLAALVTTTILERGVTVPGVEVAVFGADDRVFDDRALVQISGRVGRSGDCPRGDVVFFHNGKTLAMIRARRQIEQMNRAGGFK